MKATIPIAIPPGTKLLKLHYTPAEYDDENGSFIKEGYYVIWIHHDRQLQYGTFLELHAGGRIDRVTIRPDDSEERVRVS